MTSKTAPAGTSAWDFANAEAASTREYEDRDTTTAQGPQADVTPLVTVRSLAPRPSASYLASIAAEYGADVVISPDGSRWARVAGPHADVYTARSIKRGWHVESVGTITAVTTHPNGQVTFSGPQGHRTFPWPDTLVEATPASCPSPACAFGWGA
jgi:hypothetical protein